MAKRTGKPRSKAAARKSRVVAAGSDQPVITIRARENNVMVDATVGRDLGSLIEHLAQKWAYALRVRTRWNDDAELRQLFGNRALADLGRLGISDATIRQLVSVSHIEVELHQWVASETDVERIHEAASEIPWEYLLSAATRSSGRHQPILITRLIRNKLPAHFAPPPRNMLFVQSAPGRLNDEYGFDSERVRIQAAIGLQPQDVAILESPTISELRAKVRNGRWDAIHITGVDTHQVTRYIGDLYDVIEEKRPAVWKNISDSSGRVLDGMILRQRDIPELPICYRDLAATLLDGVNSPSVITLNLYHSGARTARELVARGAYAALGFLDEVDDDAAELFFQAFYSRWCSVTEHRSIFEAFLAAWHEMDPGNIHGTAFVIWTGNSVFEPVVSRSRPSGLQAVSEEVVQGRALEDIPIWQLLQVELEIDPEINYSLLHNDRQLIEKLTLTKLIKDELHNIAVRVELNLGGENYPYRCTHALFKETQLALAPNVKIPLTAKLPRSLRERVQSTVYVKVSCGGRTAFEDTRRVTLIPVDEWLDDTDNNPWLPSFVLPRDPAILKIVNSSRQYLIGIADDPAAGFDGYQSVDSGAPDPSAGVDAQVRAIWTAIVNEYRLQYINPPPAYSELTQRLRTPSDILASNTGTCIDLALLLASCLEYIDIYPVVVLLTGHAFVGYWRSEEAHAELVEVKAIPRAVAAVGSREAREAGKPYVDRYGWRLTQLNYDEIMKFVMSGKLAMLEATYLTGAYKFGDAVEEGRANMRSRREFDSLLDLRLARTAVPPVTPLPITNE